MVRMVWIANWLMSVSVMGFSFQLRDSKCLKYLKLKKLNKNFRMQIIKYTLVKMQLEGTCLLFKTLPLGRQNLKERHELAAKTSEVLD